MLRLGAKCITLLVFLVWVFENNFDVATKNKQSRLWCVVSFVEYLFNL